MVLHFNLPHYSGNRLCWRCPAERSRNAFTNFGPSSSWLNHEYTFPELVANPPSKHPVTTVAASAWCFKFDLLHVLDGGILRHLLGSTFWHMLCELPKGAREARFQVLWGRCKELYAEVGATAASPISTIASLQLRQVVDLQAPFASYPELGGCKAQQCKGLFLAMALLLDELQGSSEEDKQLRMCYHHLRAYYAILDGAAMILSDEEYGRLLTRARAFLITYSWLAGHWSGRGKLLFNVIPKCHYFWHLTMDGKYLNPKCTSCYKGEDYCSRVATMAASCSAGTPAPLGR
jgi:hypothetical protein